MAYNTFAITVHTYIAQLSTPPPAVLEAEEENLRKATPGGYKWAEPKDLWYLKERYHQPKSFMCLSHLSQAAMVRVRLWDKACSNRPGDPGTVLEDDTRHREEHSEFHQVIPNPTSHACSFSSKVRKLEQALLHTDAIQIKSTWKS